MNFKFLVLVGCLVLGLQGCGQNEDKNVEESSTIPTETISSWIYKGITYNVVSTLIESDTFLGKSGMTLYFLDASSTCADITQSGKNRVEIFFPEAANQSYSAPISIGHYIVPSGSQESSTQGYSGAITTADLLTEKKVKGWLNIKGEIIDISIKGVFDASYCSN